MAEYIFIRMRASLKNLRVMMWRIVSLLAEHLEITWRKPGKFRLSSADHGREALSVLRFTCYVLCGQYLNPTPNTQHPTPDIV